MGLCASTPPEGSLESFYYINIETHSILFRYKGHWRVGIVKENRKKTYIIKYNENRHWHLVNLSKRQAKFVDESAWEYYKNIVEHDITPLYATGASVAPEEHALYDD